MKKLMLATFIASAIVLIIGIGNLQKQDTKTITNAYAVEEYGTRLSNSPAVTTTITAPPKLSTHASFTYGKPKTTAKKSSTTTTVTQPKDPTLNYYINYYLAYYFVERMYTVALDRTPDEKGILNWVEKLMTHKAVASDIINGFFMSPEYLGKKKSNADIVDDLYDAMLDRSPDPTGKTSWLNKLNIGMTSQAICKGFIGSSEFKMLCSYYGIEPGNISLKYARDENYERTYFVYRLYTNCLGRKPDMTGLENWCRSLKNGTTGTKIAQGFLFSNEFKGKKYSNKDYVTILYNTILGRNPDQNGLNNWTKQLNNGKSREEVANGFMFSSEFKGQCSKAGITLGEKLKTP